MFMGCSYLFLSRVYACLTESSSKVNIIDNYCCIIKWCYSAYLPWNDLKSVAIRAHVTLRSNARYARCWLYNARSALTIFISGSMRAVARSRCASQSFHTTMFHSPYVCGFGRSTTEEHFVAHNINAAIGIGSVLPCVSNQILPILGFGLVEWSIMSLFLFVWILSWIS